MNKRLLRGIGMTLMAFGGLVVFAEVPDTGPQISILFQYITAASLVGLGSWIHRAGSWKQKGSRMFK